MLLKVADLLLMMISVLTDEALGLVYKCLRLILIRNEFKLHYMAYDQEYKTLLEAKGDIRINDEAKILSDKLRMLRLKSQVSEAFLEVHYNCLKLCLTKFTNENLWVAEKHFVGYSLSCLYFRIPKFRMELLNVLEETNSRKEVMIKGRDIDNFINLRVMEINQDYDIFDWDKEFYSYLNNEKFMKEHQLLERILQNDSWKIVFQKRNNFFIYFINEWATFVEEE